MMTGVSHPIPRIGRIVTDTYFYEPGKRRIVRIWDDNFGSFVANPQGQCGRSKLMLLTLLQRDENKRRKQ